MCNQVYSSILLELGQEGGKTQGYGLLVQFDFTYNSKSCDIQIPLVLWKCDREWGSWEV